jgi:ATP/maltotriose-dependent transcriptional regulator MalT
MPNDIVGRERELEVLAGFTAATDHDPRALLLRGEAGIGKSTLWRAAVDMARKSGYRVVACRPAWAEVRLSYAGLADLLDEVLDDVLPSLPDPQRRALEIAMLRVDTGDGQIDHRAVSAGVLAVVRALALDGSLLIAIDDAPWLDAPSAAALDFAIRRLRAERVAVIVSARSDAPSGVPLGIDRAFGHDDITRIDLAPLSLGAMHALIRSRIGQAFSRPTLGKIFDASGGNPFYALELARAIAASELVAGEPLAISASLDELLGGRLDALPPPTVEVLFVAAADPQPTIDLLDGVMGRPTRSLLKPAIDNGIIRIEDGDIRFSHPLLAAAAYARDGGDRGRVHAQLARVATDVEQRARHRALAVRGPDAVVAELLMVAARHASARGAPVAAAELFEAAIARTPEGSDELIAQRTVEASPTLMAVGERRKARALLETAIAQLGPGALRADALVFLSELVGDDVEGDRREFDLLQEALHQGVDDPRLRVRVLLKLEMLERSADHFEAALALSREALGLAESIDDDTLLAHALTRTADLEVVVGLGGEPVARFERALAVDERARIGPALGPASMLAVCLVRAGRIEEARPLLMQQRRRALDEGDESSHDLLCLFLAELEWLAGDLGAAAAFAFEGHEVAEQTGSRLMIGSTLALVALVEGTRGDIETALAHARDGARMCDEIGEIAYATYNRQVLGHLELMRGDPAAAHAHLAGFSIDRGIEGPKRISFVGDEIEALIKLDELERARVLIDELDQRGRLLDRPTLTAVAARCRALVEATTSRGSVPEASLGAALATFERLRLPLEVGRTLLVLGEIRRRAKQKRSARDALDGALNAFLSLGAPIWAENVRREMARIGGRASPSDDLTTTERRVAELVATGRSNKEVAAELFVTVKAVEANLSRVYAKLGVSSRTEMARKVVARDV